MNTCISAVQHLRPLRGGAQSHLLKASDGACYVTKFQNNPQHIRVLANEMLATNLGLALGLPMPRVEVIEVSDWLIEQTDALRISLGGAKITCFLARHAIGDWGELEPTDVAENKYSLIHGFRLLSSYQTDAGEKLWIITEADRSATTLLLPDEY